MVKSEAQTNNPIYEEEKITMSEAMRLIPGRPSLVTGARYVMKGIRGIDGTRHKLESIKVLGRRWTSAEAVQRFLIAINTPATPDSTVSPKIRGRQAAAAKREVEELLGV